MTIVNQAEQLDHLESALVSSDTPITIDTETNITDSHSDRWCMGISIAKDEKYWYIPVGHRNTVLGEAKNLPDPTKLKFLWEAIRNQTVVFHNAKFDLHMLMRYAGLDFRFYNIYDTMLMSHYINENRFHDLDSLSKDYSTVKKNTELAKAIKADWDNSWIEPMAIYAQEDAVATLQVFHALMAQFDPYMTTWNEVDKYFMYCLLDIEAKGVRLDKAACAEQEKLCRQRMAEIKSELGWDCGSSLLLQEKLFSEPPRGYGLQPKSYTAKGGKPQVNTAFLESTNHPVCGLILEYRKLQKMAGSYFSNYQTIAGSQSRLHPTFKMHGTVTGRLSCENPNLQQIPRESDVKKMFLPEPGMELWEFDYRNLEMRMAAVYSRCQLLLDAFIHERDIHQEVADRLGISRQLAKIVNFLLIYGGGVEALAFQAKISYAKAKETYNAYRKVYPEVFAAMMQAEGVAKSNGQIRMFSGRYRHFKYESETRKAFNAIIQGGSFELVKRSMLRLEKAGYDMRNQVHDSVWINGVTEADVIDIKQQMVDWTVADFGLRFEVDAKMLRAA